MQIVGTLATLLLMTAAVAQQERVNTAISEQSRAEEAARDSQKKIVTLDDEASRMLAEYRQAVAEAEGLEAYNAQLAAQVESQNQELVTMARQLTEIETTSRGVLPLMSRMLLTLEQFVKLDVPFLPEERSARIETLKDMMNRADVSISEKYRRLVEAYQIELEYGRTLESYPGKVGDKTVEFLRAGRVALLYQTLDGRETGYWNADDKKWVADNSYGDAITSGLKVAKKQSAPDFVFLPIHAAKESGK